MKTADEIRKIAEKNPHVDPSLLATAQKQLSDLRKIGTVTEKQYELLSRDQRTLIPTSNSSFGRRS